MMAIYNRRLQETQNATQVTAPSVGQPGLTVAHIPWLPPGRCGVGLKCRLTIYVAASIPGPYFGVCDLITV